LTRFAPEERALADTRPDPEELLARAKEEERRAKRGKLTIFFGAAPGVGKTYSMLEEARELMTEGRDVVVGLVEAHGRYDTAALVLGLELLPRRKIQHGHVTLEELDLDAALARRPELILVDELAHTNAEGSRHPKRWQDVEELLDAGIDVYTTVNVQHVESLNDLVAQVTGVTVRETVPDSILEEAGEIRLVDIPAEELLERLREGKVYVPDQARRALDNFFRKGNLIALRELALRRAADTVDAQMRQYQRAEGIARSWALSDRLLVAVSWSPHSARLIRAARRMATSLRAPWVAVYVDTPGAERLSPEDRAALSNNLRLAEHLGAEVVTLSGTNVAEEILRFARERRITKIVAGKTRVPRWRERIFGSFLDDLVRDSGEIDVYITLGETEEPERAKRLPKPRRSGPAGYLFAVAICGLATLLGATVLGRNQLADAAMVYLLGIVIVASRSGFGPSLLAAVLSVAAFDFYFVPPYLTFNVSDLRHALTFAVMFVVAVVISTLTQRVRAQAETSRARERTTADLYAMSRELARTTGLDAIARVAARHIHRVFESTVSVFVPTAGALEKLLREGEGPPETSDENGLARWVWANEREAGSSTDTIPGAAGLYLPLLGPQGKVGVLGVVPRERGRFEDPEQRRLLEAFVTQTATAMERARLEEESERAGLSADREQLRNKLLSSVSHDLRTPIAAITGASSVLLEDEAKLKPGEKRELLETVYDEGRRLDRLVGDLLDITRVESGALELKLEWQPIEEIVGAALNRLDHPLRGRAVRVRLPDDLPLVRFDAILMEQVIVNLLDNAIKYAPRDAPIDIDARIEGPEVSRAVGARADFDARSGAQGAKALILEVADRGPGIPVGEEGLIFEKFHRAPRGGRARGVGLGLAICQAILTAHGGRIWAENRPGGGAVFKLALPLGEEPPRGEIEEAQAEEHAPKSGPGSAPSR
jgi:two-component system sensor histidine kinase KdpD